MDNIDMYGILPSPSTIGALQSRSQEEVTIRATEYGYVLDEFHALVWIEIAPSHAEMLINKDNLNEHEGDSIRLWTNDKGKAIVKWMNQKYYKRRD